MRLARFGPTVSLIAALSACGGGSSSGSNPVQVSPAPAPAPSATCSLSAREAWVQAQLNEWYLFPDLMATGVDPAAYTTIDDYVDALTAPARAQSKDRYFTYVTSIAKENAFYQSGSSAGFGIRLSYDSVNQRLFVMEAFEGAPALAAGIDRGTEILAIGTNAGDMRTVTSIFASEGQAGVSAALGPSTAGVSRLLRVSTNGVVSDITVTKADYSLTPVSARYGAKVIDDGGRKVGYINLRTFISSADPALRSAFAQFRSQGVTEVIVDLRYNGGGLVSISELFGDLLGAGKAGQVFSYTTYRPEKASAYNQTKQFANQAEAIGATRIAFIGTTGTASASELLINAFTPYLGTSSALIGTNTYGKPVGQIGIDKASCDDRLRVIAFRTENSNHLGDYYTGLASKVAASCQAGDDFSRQLGDPAEASTRAALDFLAGKTCTSITAGGQTAQSAGKRQALTPQRPDTAQREVPGLF